jgi:putative PEP-CTERM system histidine kinase
MLVVMFGATGVISHLVAAFGFAALGLWLLAHPRAGWFRFGVAIASLLTALWAGAVVWAGRHGGSGGPLSLLETVRSAAWIALLVLHLRQFWGLDQRPSSSFLVALMLGFVVALQVTLDLLFGFGADASPLAEQPSGAMLFVASRILVAISGLVLVHNLYVNSRDTLGPEVRFFAVGLGAVFAYDLNLYTLQFLLGELSQPLWNIRGAVNTLALPLIALSLRGQARDGFYVSRNVAFNTISFSGIGLYLIAMSLLAYGLRLAGGDWGLVLQVTFLAATLIFGALAILSPRLRATVRVWISRNFYRYRYDYRNEWLRFMDTIDAAQTDLSDPQPIRERLIEALATVMDSPGGALFEPRDDGGWEQTARWRWPGLAVASLPRDDPMGIWMRGHLRVVDFQALRAEAAGQRELLTHPGLAPPPWAHPDTGIWLAVPLSHRERLTGFILLENSLAPRGLNWEDYDLLRTLGRQGASYLVESATQAALDEARSFEEFNRRFAFAMHDIKNLVSQMALVARNAERHADNPEFREDMVATLRNSVVKMTDLLALMGRESKKAVARDEAVPQQEPVDLSALLTEAVATVRRRHPAVDLSGVDRPVHARGDAGRLETMVAHLLQNAAEASAPEAPISVSLQQDDGGWAVIRIADHGVGMSASFIREELFRPFRSTKEGGYGIGAYEAREIARSHGGSLEVESRPGDGSLFTIRLPRLTATPVSQGDADVLEKKVGTAQ